MGEKVIKRCMKNVLGQVEDMELPENNIDHFIMCKEKEKKRNEEVKKKRQKLKDSQSSVKFGNQDTKDSICENYDLFIGVGEKTGIQAEKDVGCGIGEKIPERKMDASNKQHAGPSLYERSRKLKDKVPMINSHLGICFYNGMCYSPLTEENTVKLYREKVDKSLEGERNLSSIYQLYRILRTDPEIPTVKEKAGNSRIVNMLNGIYDIENHHLYPHSPDYISFSYIKANYNKHAKCPAFDKFVGQVTGGDSVLEKRLWMFLGYIIMQTNEAKVFFVVVLHIR